jgi:hypothetical protein
MGNADDVASAAGVPYLVWPAAMGFVDLSGIQLVVFPDAAGIDERRMQQKVIGLREWVSAGGKIRTLPTSIRRTTVNLTV